ncbi:putative LRR receptor-like serine/threonine-protein kinase [Carex littledalei]|uniref:Putative LRR receptor-like serine/threonine-protein kinase n=1 Tax=Carex littledalei TaxID=544730 RepID=A0A833R5A8_9POAL|nr:putative LRR receptor-like serine/threonine-protein kinase [Carex littledalei]
MQLKEKWESQYGQIIFLYEGIAGKGPIILLWSVVLKDLENIISIDKNRLSQRGNNDGTPSEGNCNSINTVLCGELKLQNGTSLPYNSSINIAVAVAMDGSLITPILQDAGKGFYWNNVCINSLHDIKNSCNNLEISSKITGTGTGLADNWEFAPYQLARSTGTNFQCGRELIGQGDFGSVYLGRLSDGKLVAVKVCSDEAQLGADSFVNDVS